MACHAGHTHRQPFGRSCRRADTVRIADQMSWPTDSRNLDISYFRFIDRLWTLSFFFAIFSIPF